MLTRVYPKYTELYTEEHHRLILSCLFENTSGVAYTNFNTKLRITYSLLLRTTDGMYVVGYRKNSFAYQGLHKYNFEITSVEDLFRRVTNMYRAFTESERAQFRAELSGPLMIPNKPTIDLIHLLKLLMFNIPRVSPLDESHTNEFILPGGQMNKGDKNISDTTCRETREELSISPNINIVIHDDRFIYLNLFDTLINKFFHTIVFYADVELSSTELRSSFVPNIEIDSIMFVTQLPLYLQPLTK